MILFTNRTAAGSFPQDLAAGDESACLLVPTATMAEHRRHTYARQGLFVRPDSVVTLSRFIEPLVRDIPAATPPYLDRLTHRLLRDNPPEVFRPLAYSAGLRRVLAMLVEEVSTAGADAAALAASAQSAEARGFQQLLAAVQDEVTRAGRMLRAHRLRAAADRLRQQGFPWRRIYLEGFHAFTPAELDIISALVPAALFITLPEWEGAEPSMLALRRMGLNAIAHETPPPAPATHFTAAHELQEAEEIARRILEANAAGTPFREIGIIVRSQQPYVPLLATTLHRFGIPARFYFQSTLREHSVARFLLSFIDAVQDNWSYAALIPLVTSPFAGLPSADANAMDHFLRRKQPSFGLPEEWLAHAPIRRWAEFTSWNTLRQTPAEWAAAFATLRSLVALPAITDGVSANQVLEWRSLFAGLDAWDAALEILSADSCLLSPDSSLPSPDPSSPLTLQEFRHHLGEILEYIPVSVRDDRRNVVHVLDVYEARQWRLPLVFVCGLLERVFPQYHSAHPILNDEERLRLREHGVLLRTADDRQREESVLFSIARHAATHQAVLSCPRANLKGDQTLPSFFLDSVAEPESAQPVRPRPLREPIAPRTAAIQSKDLLAVLRKARATLSPTAIETFLQCPYQYFARDILALASPPEAPHERLDLLMQGDILHKTLAESEGSPLFIDEIFARLFDESCAKKSVPAGHRAERVRLEVHANLRRFLESPALKGAKTVGVERPFKFPLDDGLQIRGKIDRVVTVDGRGLVVIDYKYSSRNRVRERVRSHDRGELVQGGLYLWAAEKLLKGVPAGMLYCGLRGEVAWDGWHVPIFGWQDLGESWDVAQLRDMMDRAREISIDVATRIAQGVIAPAPADTDKCRWCDARDACRVESQPAPLVQVAGQ